MGVEGGRGEECRGHVWDKKSFVSCRMKAQRSESFCRAGSWIRECFTHSMTQQPPPSPFSNVKSAALVAASKTSSTPSPVNEEHSRYFRAPISCAISFASRVPTKLVDLILISSSATGSSRRSFLRPTKRIGTFGHRSLASTTHCSNLSTWT